MWPGLPTLLAFIFRSILISTTMQPPPPAPASKCSCLFYGSQWGVAALNDLVYGRCMHLTTLAALAALLATLETTTREYWLCVCVWAKAKNIVKMQQHL